MMPPKPAVANLTFSGTSSVDVGFLGAAAGLGGIMGWMCVHPFNTAAVRMNLASTQPNYQPTGFVAFFLKTGKERGYASFYDGIGAGVIRQIFYATSRFGLFETFRDAI